MDNEVFEMAYKLISKLQETQGENILAAAQCIADALEHGGIIQAFGSGHSYAGATELCGRAGGYVPSKVIKDPAGGMYESIQGVGEILMKKVEILKEDVVFCMPPAGSLITLEGT